MFLPFCFHSFHSFAFSPLKKEKIKSKYCPLSPFEVFSYDFDSGATLSPMLEVAWARAKSTGGRLSSPPCDFVKSRGSAHVSVAGRLPLPMLDIHEGVPVCCQDATSVRA